MASKPEFYTVGWICAIPIEYVAACELLDEQYTDNHPKIDPHRDSNLYTFGRIHHHNIVISCLPDSRYGITSAAIVAERMRANFPALRFGLLVGIAGGAPSKKHDIRLGDVVVSSPTAGYGGVLQYDYGKDLGENGSDDEHGFQKTGYLAPPPEFLLNALSLLKTKHMRQGHRIAETVKNISEKNKRLKQYCRPDPALDKLYVSGSSSDQLVERKDRNPDGDDPVIHYGLVASSNALMKNWRTRNALTDKHEVLCFEMEAAGVTGLPYLVIRGICDYSDAHKSDEWQGYASATAAAYAKELLEIIPKPQAESPSANEAIFAKSEFDIPFNLSGVPVTKKFVGRLAELKHMKEVLLPNGLEQSRKVFVLYGLGGIGKTQLAVKFMRMHQRQFSSIIWLDGSSIDNLKQSMVRFAHRLAAHGIRMSKEMVREDSIDKQVEAVLAWLSASKNGSWLLVFDNVNRNSKDSTNKLAYKVDQFFPAADHGSILITTRLAQLQQLGEFQQVREVDPQSALDILSGWYKKAEDNPDYQRLLSLLDGLPLAITQAGAYLQQSGMSIKTYLRLYEDKQIDANEVIQGPDFSLSDYPKRNVWTTWKMSFEAVVSENQFAARLLLLWSCCDRNDFHHGLFANAIEEPQLRQALREWIGDIAQQEESFYKAIELLRSYSLVETALHTDGYSMHSVLHRWAFLYQAQHNMVELEILAFLTIASATPTTWTHRWWHKAVRVFPHAQACYERLFNVGKGSYHTDTGAWWRGLFESQRGSQPIESSLRTTGLNPLLTINDLVTAFHRLANLYYMLRRYHEPIIILFRVYDNQIKELQNPESEERTKDHYISFFNTVSMLGLAHYHNGKADMGESALLLALDRGEKMLGSDHPWVLDKAQALGAHYLQQDRLDEAEKMLVRVLADKPKPNETTYMSTLNAFRALGWLYRSRSSHLEEKGTSPRATIGYKEAMKAEYERTIIASQMLGDIYWDQGNLSQAEQSYRQALSGLKILAGPGNRFTLEMFRELAEVCAAQGKYEEAKKNFLQALEGYEALPVATGIDRLTVLTQLGLLYVHGDKLKAEKRSISQGEQEDIDPSQPTKADVTPENFQFMRALGRLKSSSDSEVIIKALSWQLELGLQNLSDGSPNMWGQFVDAWGDELGESTTKIYAILKQWFIDSGYPLSTTGGNDAL